MQSGEGRGVKSEQLSYKLLRPRMSRFVWKLKTRGISRLSTHKRVLFCF